MATTTTKQALRQKTAFREKAMDGHIAFLCPALERAGTTQCASQLLLAHWISRDSKSGAAAPILATKRWEVGSVIRRPFNMSVEHINRAPTFRYRAAASLDVFI